MHTEPSADPVIFDVEGMSCAACASRVERELAEQPGVRTASVNFATARARVEIDPSATDVAALEEAIRGIGYELRPSEGPIGDPGSARQLWITIAAAGLTVPIVVLAMSGLGGELGGWIQAALATPVEFWLL